MKYLHSCRNLIHVLGLFVLLSACQKNESSPATDKQAPQPNPPVEQGYLKDADIKDIKESLKYTCKSETGDSVNVNVNENPSHCEPVSFSLPDTELEIAWSCPQSDVEKLKRPMPSKASIKVQAKIEVKDGNVLADLSVRNIKEFLKNINVGNTSYSSCLFSFVSNIEKNVKNYVVSIKTDNCTKLTLNSAKLTINLNSYFEDLHQEMASRREKEVLFQTVLPFYDKIDGFEFSAPPTQCDTVFFSSKAYPNEEAATADYTFSDKATYVVSRDFIENKLLRTIQNNSDCANRILELLNPLQHISRKCVQDTGNVACSIQISNYLDILKSIDKSFSYQGPDRLSEKFKRAGNDPKSFETIYTQWSLQVTNPKAPICDYLPVGTSKTANVKIGGSSKSYRLTRTAEDITEVAINVEFKPTCDLDEKENKRLSDRWFEKVNTCLSKVSPYLRGSDGHEVHLKLISKSEFEAPAGTSITVIGNEETFLRGDSEMYPLNFECSTIVHEILHLTGLVDEYVENGEFFSQYNCRAPGPKDSIMSHHYYAYRDTEKDGRSLLRPVHARAVLFSNCEQKNKVYYQCAQYAYRGGGCSYIEYPKECSNGSTAWIDE